MREGAKFPNLLTLAVLLAAMVLVAGGQSGRAAATQETTRSMPMQEQANLHTAVFAGGCFWCVQADFEKVPGVVAIISGYTGGSGANPTYEDYAGKGHVEAVEVRYNPQVVSYRQLLDYFWRHVDPTDAGGQFVDRGPQYRAAIFYQDDAQQRLAAESKKELGQSGRFKKPIVTEILPLGKFYPAEAYHEDYHRTHALK